jgi:hypothetical protein
MWGRNFGTYLRVPNYTATYPRIRPWGLQMSNVQRTAWEACYV